MIGKGNECARRPTEEEQKAFYGYFDRNPCQIIPKSCIDKFAIASASGATSANAIGLTTQVPVQAIYLTSGKSRRVALEKQMIEFRHAPGWQLMPGLAGNAIRALSWIGPERIGEAVPLLRRLPASTAQEIASVRSRMPTWMAEAVSRVLVNAG